MYEGMAQPSVMTLQGLMLSMTQLKTMLNFYNLEHLTTLTDDRGFIRTIFPSQFQATRIMSALYPWKASWELIAYVFGQPGFPAEIENGFADNPLAQSYLPSRLG